MTDVEVKEELTTLLEEVKREEHSSSDESDFIGELLGGEDVPIPPSPAEEDDIQKLQELLEQRKRELNATEEVSEGNSCSSNNRKRKTPVSDERKPSRDGSKSESSKRKRKSVDDRRRSRSGSPRDAHNSPSKSPSPPATSRPPANSTNNQQQSPLEDEVGTAYDAELEITNLLKAEDYNSDEEAQSSDQAMASTSGLPPAYGFPPAYPMYDPTCQMMGAVPPNSYPIMYNMGLQPQFYPTNMGNMPTMGYGFPQMNIPSDQNDVECLPVVNNAGFSGMPTFKRIKLERSTEASNEDKDETEVSAEDGRRKVLEACTTLLEQLEFAEQTGKFTFTPTIAKLNPNVVSNSIVQKISNVSYDFHSIGPKLNLADWGLREIGSRNVDVAKQIAISADKYFAKISEKANTIARKLIKVEDAKTDDNKEETDMEVEEPTLSSFLKNSMTQTDAVACKECVARKRIVGHNIGVQTTVYTGSVGSQTTPVIDDSVRLAAGLNINQLKALYEFSSLIREPPKNTTVEMYRLREILIEMYNLSQRSHTGPVPNMSSHNSLPPSPRILGHASVLDPRTGNRSNLDSRISTSPGMPIRSLTPPAMQATRQSQFNSYQTRPMNVPRHQPPTMQMPRYQPPAMQMPIHQPPAAQFSGYPHPSSRNPGRPPDALQGARRSYGRGSQPR